MTVTLSSGARGARHRAEAKTLPPGSTPRYQIIHRQTHSTVRRCGGAHTILWVRLCDWPSVRAHPRTASHSLAVSVAWGDVKLDKIIACVQGPTRGKPAASTMGMAALALLQCSRKCTTFPSCSNLMHAVHVRICNQIDESPNK